MSLPETIHPALAEALFARGYETLTPVQTSRARRRDRGIATCWCRPRPARARPSPSAWPSRRRCWASEAVSAAAGAPLGLVIAPTRELAMQVQRELEWLYAGDRRAASPPASAAWTSAPSAARSSAAPTSSSARPAACATTSRSGALDLVRPPRRRARRSRRDARPRLPRGSRVHPRRRARRPPHADVLGHRAARHRRTGQDLPARRRARHRHRRQRAARRYRVPASSLVRNDEREHAVINTLLLLRRHQHPRLLPHPRSREAPDRRASPTAASPSCRCRAS